MRKFKDPLIQKLYAGLRASPPKLRATGLGQAYYYGFENPDASPEIPRCGLRGSQARAAWAAGVDNARAAKKSQT